LLLNELVDGTPTRTKDFFLRDLLLNALAGGAPRMVKRFFGGDLPLNELAGGTPTRAKVFFEGSAVEYVCCWCANKDEGFFGGIRC
jgi:hypothetical protein